MRMLTFALTKGRLADKTLALFEQIGISCTEMNRLCTEWTTAGTASNG